MNKKQTVIMIPAWQYDKMIETHDKLLENYLRLKVECEDLKKAKGGHTV